MTAYKYLTEKYDFSRLQLEVESMVFENSELINFFNKPTNITISIENNPQELDKLFVLKIQCKSDSKKFSQSRAEHLADLISDCFFEIAEKSFGEQGREELLECFGGCVIFFNDKLIY